MVVMFAELRLGVLHQNYKIYSAYANDSSILSRKKQHELSAYVRNVTFTYIQKINEAFSPRLSPVDHTPT